jgi:hypothetical protein
MTQAPHEHRLELLRVFKNTPADLDANRLGQLGPGQLPVTRAALDAEFGPGREHPRVHWDCAFNLTSFVTVENAPFACDVIAYFRGQPGPDTAAYEISLRRHRG